MTFNPDPLESVAQDFMVIQKYAREGETFALANNVQKARKMAKEIDSVLGMVMTKLEGQEGAH